MTTSNAQSTSNQAINLPTVAIGGATSCGTISVSGTNIWTSTTTGTTTYPYSGTAVGIGTGQTGTYTIPNWPDNKELHERLKAIEDLLPIIVVDDEERALQSDNPVVQDAYNDYMDVLEKLKEAKKHYRFLKGLATDGPK